MISSHFDPGTVRHELATAIRQVNARLAEIGSPDLPELRQAWVRLDRDLEQGKCSGDNVACRNAVERYRITCLDAIKGAGDE